MKSINILNDKYKLYEDGSIYNNKTKKCLKKIKHSSGYLKYILSNENKIFVTFYVHRLVATYFISPFFGQEVNHLDGNKLNNHISNLQWCSRFENLQHAHKVGLINNKGENSKKSKLTWTQVNEIRELILEGICDFDLSLKFKVTRRTINDIRNKKSWRDQNV